LRNQAAPVIFSTGGLIMNRAFEFPVKREQVYLKDGSLVPREAILRADTREVLGVVSPGYRMIEHKDAVESAEQILNQIGKWDRTSVETTKKGARLFVKYAFMDMKFKVTRRNGQEDSVAPTLTLSNSYDGLLRFGFVLGAYQFICSNGLRIGHDIFEIVHKHTEGLELDGILTNAVNAMEHFREMTYPRYLELAETPVGNIREYLEHLVIERHVPRRLTEKVANQTITDPSVQTMWDFYSEFTHVLTHRADKMGYERKDQVGQIVARAFGL
jgi:hypothetical protein